MLSADESEWICKLHRTTVDYARYARCISKRRYDLPLPKMDSKLENSGNQPYY